MKRTIHGKAAIHVAVYTHNYNQWQDFTFERDLLVLSQAVNQLLYCNVCMDVSTGYCFP